MALQPRQSASNRRFHFSSDKDLKSPGGHIQKENSAGQRSCPLHREAIFVFPAAYLLCVFRKAAVNEPTQQFSNGTHRRKLSEWFV
jgi:hypothetical protein